MLTQEWASQPQSSNLQGCGILGRMKLPNWTLGCDNELTIIDGWFDESVDLNFYARKGLDRQRVSR
jgi:hypothetical protein